MPVRSLPAVAYMNPRFRDRLPHCGHAAHSRRYRERLQPPGMRLFFVEIGLPLQTRAGRPQSYPRISKLPAPAFVVQALIEMPIAPFVRESAPDGFGTRSTGIF